MTGDDDVLTRHVGLLVNRHLLDSERCRCLDAYRGRFVIIRMQLFDLAVLVHYRVEGVPAYRGRQGHYCLELRRAVDRQCGRQ